jgi:hypothetical protein
LGTAKLEWTAAEGEGAGLAEYKWTTRLPKLEGTARLIELEWAAGLIE